MANNWLVFGGWSLPPDILSPIFGDNATYFDINTLFERIFSQEALAENWDIIIFDTIKNTAPDQPLNIAGWSTGAFFAYALSQRINPKKTVLLSATPSFCKREGFIHGQDRSVVKVMRRQLARNKTSVLKNFQLQCGLHEYNPKAENYSVQELDWGLQFLENISLLPLQKSLCPTHIFHGKQDAIVPYLAGESFAREIGAAKTILPGGHAFFLDDASMGTIRQNV
jgi:pimeloyl-ACP methyl ester carboxylesterase